MTRTLEPQRVISIIKDNQSLIKKIKEKQKEEKEKENNDRFSRYNYRERKSFQLEETKEKK